MRVGGIFRAFAALAAVTLAGGCANDVARLVDDARVRTRIGVMANTDVGWITETAALERALRFYRQCDVRAVVIAGSVTRNGYRNQFEVLDQVWRKVFGGTDVRLILEDGRHEVDGFAFGVSSNRPSARCDVLTFYGEGRRTLTDELCYYPRERNAICAGSMHGVKVQRGFEGWEEELPNGKTRPGPQAVRALKAAQGLLVSVYADAVRIRRLDFTFAAPAGVRKGRGSKLDGVAYAEDVAEPWEVGAPADLEQTPQFWGDTRIQLRRGTDRKGPILTVLWPSVQRRFTGARARSYEVSVAFADDPHQPFQTKSVLTDGFFLAEERDGSGGRCVFREPDLPEASDRHQAVVFSVTPIGAFGRRGKTFSSEALPLSSVRRN